MSKMYRLDRPDTIFGIGRFAFFTTAIAVLAIAAIAAIAVFANGQARPSTDLPESAGSSTVIQGDGGIVITEGDIEVDVFIDPLCPACKNFEELYTPVLLAEDSVGMTIHPISILDRASAGTKYSTRSAASVYAVAVAAPDKVAEYVDSLFQTQPDEGTPGLSNEALIAAAESVGADISEADITEFTRFVSGITLETPRSPSGSIATPTVTVDGDFFAVTGDPLADLATITE